MHRDAKHIYILASFYRIASCLTKTDTFTKHTFTSDTLPTLTPLTVWLTACEQWSLLLRSAIFLT